MSDKRWVLESPKSKHIDKKSDSEEPKKTKLETNDLLTNSKFLSSKEKLNLSVKSFVSYVKTSDEVRSNPKSWLLALTIVGPGILFGIIGVESSDELVSKIASDNAFASMLVPVVYDFLVFGQFFLGPGFCLVLAKNRFLAPALLVAMGSSTVLLLNNQIIVDLAIANEFLAIVLSVICLLPFLSVLKNKRKQLPPGNIRHSWAFLMSVSILMFSLATLVEALENINSIDVSQNMALSSLLIVAFAIGYAWPKGAELVEDVAEDIIARAM